MGKYENLYVEEDKGCPKQKIRAMIAHLTDRNRDLLNEVDQNKRKLARLKQELLFEDQTGE